MVKSFDSKFGGVQTGGQAGTQDSVVHHVEERGDAVPAFVIEPDLHMKRRKCQNCQFINLAKHDIIMIIILMSLKCDWRTSTVPHVFSGSINLVIILNIHHKAH